jgi:DNA-binding MarR family transcriptional regulator
MSIIASQEQNCKHKSTIVSKVVSKYSAFEHKRYLRMLTMTTACPLSHSERLVLSYHVYKSRDTKAATNANIAQAVGLTRKTVSKAIASLRAKGVYVDNPALVKAEWFAKPHDDGAPRCYRHYLVQDGLTELENTIYWMLWSLPRRRYQSKVGLAALTGYSEYRIRLGLRKLVKLMLIRRDGRTMTMVNPTNLDYWQDRKRKAKVIKKAATEPSPEPSPEPTLTEDWVQVLVDFQYTNEKYLAAAIEKQIPLMKTARISMSDIQEYWRTTLMMIAQADNAFNFIMFKFDGLLRDVAQVHREKGKDKSCIHLLTHATKQLLDKPAALLW